MINMTNVICAYIQVKFDARQLFMCHMNKFEQSKCETKPCKVFQWITVYIFVCFSQIYQMASQDLKYSAQVIWITSICIAFVEFFWAL